MKVIPKQPFTVFGRMLSRTKKRRACRKHNIETILTEDEVELVCHTCKITVVLSLLCYLRLTIGESIPPQQIANKIGA